MLVCLRTLIRVNRINYFIHNFSWLKSTNSLLEVFYLRIELRIVEKKSKNNEATYCEIRIPLCLVAIIGLPFWLSSIDSRMPLLFSFDHGISTKRMECGSVFWVCCDEEDGAKISDNDVNDSMDFTEALSILLR